MFIFHKYAICIFNIKNKIASSLYFAFCFHSIPSTLLMWSTMQKKCFERNIFFIQTNSLIFFMKNRWGIIYFYKSKLSTFLHINKHKKILLKPQTIYITIHVIIIGWNRKHLFIANWSCFAHVNYKPNTDPILAPITELFILQNQSIIAGSWLYWQIQTMMSEQRRSQSCRTHTCTSDLTTVIWRCLVR